MELTVSKADLQKELQLCQGVVEKRSTIPILSNVLLRPKTGSCRSLRPISTSRSSAPAPRGSSRRAV